MRRVLVVEDDRFVYDAIDAAFAMKGGFEVAHAGDGPSALTELAARRLDLALVDIGLPKVSGITIAREAAAKRVPVILMSGYPDVIAKSGEYQFPILPKPFRIGELVDRFDEVIAEAVRVTAELRQQMELGATLVAEARATPEDAAQTWLQICERMRVGS